MSPGLSFSIVNRSPGLDRSCHSVRSFHKFQRTRQRTRTDTPYSHFSKNGAWLRPGDKSGDGHVTDTNGHAHKSQHSVQGFWTNHADTLTDTSRGTGKHQADTATDTSQTHRLSSLFAHGCGSKIMTCCNQVHANVYKKNFTAYQKKPTPSPFGRQV